MPLRPRLHLRLAALLAVAGVVPLLGAGLWMLDAAEAGARREASARHDDLARLGAALVGQHIEGARDKLMTVSRLLARELSEPSVGAYAPHNVAYREAVASRLEGQVDPPDLYLEVVYYAAGKQVLLVDQHSQMAYGAPVEPGQEPPDSPKVSIPLATGELHICPVPELRGDLAVLPMGAPVRAGQTTLGVLVADVDLRRVEALLATVGQERYRVGLLDGDGRPVSAVGSVDGATLSGSAPVDLVGWSVEVEEPEAVVLASVADARRQTILWVGLALLLSLGLGTGFAARIARPIRRLTDAAGRLEAGDLATRSGLCGDDEIGRLGAAFDRMAAAVEALDEARNGFVATVSHELRTPLTSIRLSLSNVTDGVVGRIDERARETLARVEGDIRRLSEMVEALLELARLQSGNLAPTRQRVDLAALARQTIASFGPLAAARRVTLAVDGAGAAEVDSTLAGRVLANLVDNAIKFGPEGGAVAVEVGEGRWTVVDDGPGLADDGLFERFRQGSTQGVKNRGVGLGLALVREIVDLHGGRIEVGDGGRSRITVRW